MPPGSASHFNRLSPPHANCLLPAQKKARCRNTASCVRKANPAYDFRKNAAPAVRIRKEAGPALPHKRCGKAGELQLQLRNRPPNAAPGADRLSPTTNIASCPYYPNRSTRQGVRPLPASEYEPLPALPTSLRAPRSTRRRVSRTVRPQTGLAGKTGRQPAKRSVRRLMHLAFRSTGRFPSRKNSDRNGALLPRRRTEAFPTRPVGRKTPRPAVSPRSPCFSARKTVTFGKYRTSECR